MAIGKLTVAEAKSFVLPGRYSDGDGLHLYVKKGGAKSWVLRLQREGRRGEYGLGSFKDVTLAQARAKAAEIRRQVNLGITPATRGKATSPDVMTFREAAEAAYAEQVEGWRNGKHQKQWLSTLQQYVFPAIGDVPVSEVGGPAIRDLIAPIWLKKKETSGRILQRIGVVLDWAYTKGLRLTDSPCAAVRKSLPRQNKQRRHHPALEHPKVADLMADLVSTDSVGRAALRFTILTAVRSGEARGATWKEIDLDAALWTIPGNRMKAKREHIVPLSPSAIEVLKLMAETFGDRADAVIFPGKSGKPLSDMTLLKVLRDAGHAVITVHGFRSSFRDWAAEEMVFSGEVVEAALAHTVKNKVEAAYRRTNYLEKRRELMAAWDAYITAF